MAVSQRKPSNSNFQFQQDEGSLIGRRQSRFLADGSYLFQDELRISGPLQATLITCVAWLFELYELTAGEVFFLSGSMRICPRTSRFGVYYPPFTISQPRFKNATGHLIGVASDNCLPNAVARRPVLFETTSITIPENATQVAEIVTAGEYPQSVELNPKPSLLSVRAKRLIDENYLSYPLISRIAQRLGITHEHLSRQFKRDFEMSPATYLHQLRLADAPLRLAKGEEIINISQDVGYNDLSRFYKQFRKSTKTSPGVCQTLLKPNRG
jgi:AraC-like DNA-binding protein